jgi:hypothetical protein
MKERIVEVVWKRKKDWIILHIRKIYSQLNVLSSLKAYPLFYKLY